MPKVSVIIPVYRAAATIVRCVESLLLQTLADLEVILVDDHGGDDSLELVKALLANHHRKAMFHFAATPQNSGPGEARNVGIQLAKVNTWLFSIVTIGWKLQCMKNYTVRQQLLMQKWFVVMLGSKLRIKIHEICVIHSFILV